MTAIFWLILFVVYRQHQRDAQNLPSPTLGDELHTVSFQRGRWRQTVDVDDFVPLQVAGGGKSAGGGGVMTRPSKLICLFCFCALRSLDSFLFFPFSMYKYEYNRATGASVSEGSHQSIIKEKKIRKIQSLLSIIRWVLNGSRIDLDRIPIIELFADMSLLFAPPYFLLNERRTLTRKFTRFTEDNWPSSAAMPIDSLIDAPAPATLTSANNKYNKLQHRLRCAVGRPNWLAKWRKWQLKCKICQSLLKWEKKRVFFCNERNREECTEYSERDRLLSIMEQIPVGFAAGPNSYLVYLISRFLLCQEISLFASLIVPSGVRNNMRQGAPLFTVSTYSEKIKRKPNNGLLSLTCFRAINSSVIGLCLYWIWKRAVAAQYWRASLESLLKLCFLRHAYCLV